MSADAGPIQVVNMPRGADPAALLAGLWQGAGGDARALEQVQLAGQPVLPSVFRVGDLATSTVAAAALAAASLGEQRGQPRQRISVDMRHAETAFLSERYLQVDGDWPDPFSPTWGYYRSADGGWVQVHTSFPHHEAGAARVLGCAPRRDAFEAAIGRWQGAELEQAMAAAGVPCFMLRSREAWLATAQGAAVADLPLMAFERIGDAPPRSWPPGERLLSGLRVLDLTRVVAGPVCGRTLTEHGADVLRVAGPHLPAIPKLVIDTGRGKRSTHLDLRQPADRQAFDALLAGAHVMVQGYRPGAVAGLGYGPQVVAEKSPGIVYLSLCAWSHAGPWAARRGFDSLVQVASGIAEAGGRAAGQDGPGPLPCQALDHATGYLAAFGVLMALARQAREGGSWHVRLSLAQTGEWLQRLGRVDGLGRTAPPAEAVADLMDEADTPFGHTRFVRPAAQFEHTPAFWATPPVPLGSHAPVWAG